jgi:ABC-2 type transport system ATP-binding protein
MPVLQEDQSAHFGLAIETSELGKSYGDVRALSAVSFRVPERSVFALLGPNGAGKSTTVKILTTLTRPDGGSACVAGYDVLERPALVRRAIGYVSQKPAVDREATGIENLTLQGRLYGLRGAALRRRADELLERFGLAPASRRLAGSYSGGMQRKLDIAMGLVHRPQVLFLDEPTTGLDPEARSELWGEIERLTREDGLTVLLTTHYLEEADRLADRIAIVDEGRIVVEGAPEELKSELRGDGLNIELAAETTLAEVGPATLGIDGLCELTIDGRRLRARSDDGAATLPALVARLEAAGQRVTSASVARPSLDDVYLHHTGQSYRQNEETIR